MKKLAAILMVLLISDRDSNDMKMNQGGREKRYCTGYSILEFGKAIDCNGDTVQLSRVNGLQTLVAHNPE